ncbi:TPA: aminoglycoside N(3)-acetyltransferase [Campylobacter coli]|uniref:AAC(3) family N-acetyltransferase n=1 Tax=Campylobacter coli TaxID=195 RepID=UPI00156F469F|nr:AAC(3) family N-acetyltransferase [Campylobacter coli]HDV6424590.1 aminoglycoside N(3)-acetyltransferase [Campylobacter coli]HEB9346032.1 aminoglycoside N(3)-acetyltransferase [Campylobacter coli]HEC1736435.1 aminoglycoside N(3)-acetyltransferase [Campylobacter coli]HEF1918549.1 aminoglycoside N(3)-acetyltransferase [Campylobacter coli]
MDIGIKAGDMICVHTEIFNLGTPLLKKEKYLKTLIECFLEILKNNGTLVMPTFSYSFCKNEIYNKNESKCTVGLLNNFFRRLPGVIRSNDPIFSFAAYGFKANLFQVENNSCFGKNSGYDILIKNDAKIVYLGADWAHTFVHYIEEKVGVDYRYFKTFRGYIIDENNQKHERKIDYYVRCLDKPSELNLLTIAKLLEKSGRFKKRIFGGSNISAINTNDFKNIIIQALNTDKHILVRKD